MILLYFIISLLASIIGAICGIGGGVIIKPIMDFFALDNVATISFLSACTVLAMSMYNVSRSAIEKIGAVDFRFSTPLAVGAALGGVAGKIFFDEIIALSGNQILVGRVQSICMVIITLGTFLYTLCKRRINTKRSTSIMSRILIGVSLGVLSSFLGIGGGPIILVAFFYFFSMDTKTAAQNSLYIIFMSQVASLLTALVTKSVPPFNWISLGEMVAGGILGGMIGREASKKMSHKDVDNVFLTAMGLIILISVYNSIR